MARPGSLSDQWIAWVVNSAKSKNETKRAGAGKATATGVTPMMVQYMEIKAANPDSLLFYRMGDFYELFFEDAVIAARALSIALTKRGKHHGKDIEMCGVPVRAADDYLQRLIRLGFRVAVCEQTEDPAAAKKRGAKSVVRRDVVRLITPGTLTEDSLLDTAAHNFLTALFEGKTGSGATPRIAVVSIEISTGEFQIGEVDLADVAGELARISPSEILITDRRVTAPELMQAMPSYEPAITPVPGAYFDSAAGMRDMKSQLGVTDIAGFGNFSRTELAAVGAILKYIDLTQIGHRPVLRPPQKTEAGDVLLIDAATRGNLELTRTTSGERRGSLLHAIDRTQTGAGARELASRLSTPLSDPEQITNRLDAVAWLLDAGMVRQGLRATLRTAPDTARALSRLAFERGGPRDLGAIKQALSAATACLEQLGDGAGTLELPHELKRLQRGLNVTGLNLLEDLEAGLADELPVHCRDGGFVLAGFRSDLDETRSLRDESRQVMAALQAKYQQATGVKSLKIRHNNVLGYFVEVTPVNADQLNQAPHNETYIHRQTLAGAVRFSTTELAEIEVQIVTAAERALAIELEVFTDFAARVGKAEVALTEMSHSLACLDVYCGLSEIAEEQSYVRPKVDNSEEFLINGGRHPVVEQALVLGGEGPFIENDCILSSAENNCDDRNVQYDQDDLSGTYPSGFDERTGAHIIVLTGPNMAGKSTYLRQNALIVVLAQMGSYVPAHSAHIGIVDRLFSRVGASDELARGRSTFMVEMVETAAILNRATRKSLVILDEIGRGTATFDGLSIAWATIEYIHGINRCRTLFATHYHELTALADKLMGLANATIEVREWKDEIVLLHRVIPGAADHSYGIQVAKLAGLPRAVITRAGEVLQLLENSDKKISTDHLISELPLFAAARPKSHVAAQPDQSELANAVADINPDDLSPRDALEAIYRLKAVARSQSEGEK